MKKVYILLIRSNTILSQLIKFTTKAEYTHASISLSENLFPFYSFGRKFTYSVIPAGFKKESLDSGFLKYNKKIPYALYSIDVTDDQYLLAQEYINNIVHSKKRHGFNSLGLFSCKLGIPIKRKNRMFCSEFVASVLNYCGVGKFKNPTLVQPIQLLNIDGINLIQKGKIEDFSM